jgi:hypothetical protein
MVGVNNPFAPPMSGAAPPSRTMVGMPIDTMQAVREAQRGPSRNEPVAPSPVNRTMLGGIAPAPRPFAGQEHDPDASFTGGRTAVLGSPPGAFGSAPAGQRAGQDPTSRTMIGVAMPGIAPLAPGEDEAHDYQPAAELGATIAPQQDHPAWSAPSGRPHRAPLPLQPSKVASKPARPPKRAVAIVVAAGVLATAAVLFAVLWPSPPPLVARARVDAEGREVVEIRCASCPDGTQLSLGGASAKVAAGVAEVPVASPLSVGQNILKIAIDRPGSGRDETVGVQLHVAYRIRPDLQTLQGERPSIQVVIEAVDGTTVAIDGRQVPLMNGRAIETIDVTEACTGLADDAVTLARQIPYAVTPKDGPAEQGTVNVSVRILPLRIDAPGPHAVIDGKNFVLAGRTMKGAEVLAAGRPIPVRPDGSFAQTMNVSSVGATQIEVRAKMAGMAPRLTRIGVRRVDSLEVAAREFVGQSPSPVGWAAIAADLPGSIGKSTVLSGEVIEVRRQTHQTIVLLDVSSKSGCSDAGKKGGSGCHVRLVQGADNPLQRGDLITAYGTVLRAFAVAGKPDVPEVQVDFTLKGLR